MTVDHMEIQPDPIFFLKKEHLAELVMLEGLCFSGPWSGKEYERALKSRNFKVMGISPSNILRAYISFSMAADEAEIVNLAVYPGYRRKGLARRLVSRTLEFCTKAGVKNIYLEVRTSNVPALSIYRHFGFKEAARRKNYYPDNLEDALVMRLEL
jgi:[ribosomal protein S18]-alanine N-acetyltransferase